MTNAMLIQSIYQQAIRFAASKHAESNQTIPGTNLPYVVHLSNVAMEVLVAHQQNPDFNLEMAVSMALLHDTLEDTSATVSELVAAFGPEVAEGVAALTKNKALAKPERMADSLNRIQALPKEAAIVKLADRITNLQAPPAHWDMAKKESYLQEARLIGQRLSEANANLAQRLQKKIIEYQQYI